MSNMTQSSCINSIDVNKVISEQAKLLVEASGILTEVLSNLRGFLQELSCISETNYKRNEGLLKEYEESLDLTRKMTQFIDRVNVEFPAMAKSLKQSEAHEKDYREKLEVTQAELKLTNGMLVVSEKAIATMEEKADTQATYTAAMGSIIGTMLWKTSKTEETINTFIATETIQDFLIMSNVTMKSFMESYKGQIPRTDSYEYKFTCAVIGININIAAQPVGRNYVINDSVGLNVIQNLIKFIDLIPMPEARVLKRMCLILLYNISICKRGAMLIQQSENGVKNILKCIRDESAIEIQTLTLTMINALLSEIPTKELLKQVMTLISTQDLDHLKNKGDDDLNLVCTKLESKIIAMQQTDSESSF